MEIGLAVGGAFLSSFLNVVFDRLATSKVFNWIRGRRPDQKLLQRLETSLFVVQAVLNDAEQKQITNTRVKKWLADLEDAVYVADDLLDEVSTKAATQKGSGNFLSRSLNLEERELVNKIEGIIGRLESIVKLKDALHLKDFAEDNISSWRVPSTSLVEKSEIYGRDEDKEAIIKLLLDDTSDAKIPVISIVGIGGIGKTTLAQLVYNDDKVTGKFNFRAWVCVGEKLDVINVTKTILPNESNANDFDSLQTKLKKELEGKTFLIVLDDMWDDRRYMWKDLLKPFQYGNTGSKILVTTRSERVASVNPIIPPYKLSLLSDEDCWSVFLKHSFLSTKSREYATLEQIGRRIVKKCKGLPLAVETLGGLLRTKCDVKDWNDILESEIWEFSKDESMIIPALRISYHHLPSHLKRCFVYCSLFPQDHYFDKDELILLWMAEEFLQPMGKKPLEEIGCVYFNELLARSFFQPADRTITSDRYFVMHDLMHDLATFCAGEFYFRAEELESAAEICCKTRHLSYNVRGNYPISKLLTACQGTEYMRTFVDMNSGHFNTRHMNSEDFDTKLISQLKFLRVLSFQSVPPLYSLPDSIGDLIHLRYLNLSFAYIVTLPESLSKLYNLQTLKLNGCYGLKMLPSDMQGCCMLPSLGQLPSLKHLEISNFENLQSIGAEFYQSGESCSETPFRSLETLKFDGLCCWEEWRSHDDAFRQLKQLTIEGCPMLIGDLPNHLPALEELTIDRRCNQLACSLPRAPAMLQLRLPLWNELRMEELPLSLPSLSIDGNQLVKSALEAMAHNQPTCLRQLQISFCNSAVSFPGDCLPSSLQELTIQCCKKLDFPMQQQQQHDSLRKLTIYQSCDSLTSFPLNAFPNLTHLRVDECENMESFAVVSQPHDTAISSLRSLDIKWCPKFASFSTLRMAAPQLSSLTIWYCPKINSFLEGGLPPNLRKLDIKGCDKLVSCLASMDLRSHGLTWLSIDIKSESVKSLSP